MWFKHICDFNTQVIWANMVSKYVIWELFGGICDSNNKNTPTNQIKIQTHKGFFSFIESHIEPFLN